MIAGRRGFFDAGHYQRLADEVAERVRAVLPSVPDPVSFKKLLYDRPARHEPEATLADETGFELIDTTTIRYPLSLRGPGQVANLLLMTPFFWSADDSVRAGLAALDSFDAEVDVVMHAYRRTADVPAGVE